MPSTSQDEPSIKSNSSLLNSVQVEVSPVQTSPFGLVQFANSCSPFGSTSEKREMPGTTK